jgi:Pentapeptide repeats (8 copies)
MNTSEPYHQPVVEALCAFVCDGTKEDKGQGPPAADIQAGVTVIGRRGPGEGVVDLAEAHIPKVGLPGADLRGAILFNADLSHAGLRGAYVTRDQLDKACGNDSTKLPLGMTIKECK